MRKIPPLTSLRAFEAAARHASLKKAAEELFVSPTAISHQIQRLEDYIGKPLFVRETRRVRLTQTAHALLPVLSQSFDAIETVFEQLQYLPDEAVLNLSSTPSFIAQFLIPRLAKLQQDLPGLALRFEASDALADLSSSNMDVAIRYGTGRYPGCVSHLLYSESFSPMCSPRLGIHSLEQMLQAPLLHVEWRRDKAMAPTWQRWSAVHGVPLPIAPTGVIFTDDSHLIQAVLAGQGVGLLSNTLLHRELEAGLLLRPGNAPAVPGRSFYFVFSERTGKAAQLQALHTWLDNELAAIRAGGLGEVTGGESRK